ncbi:MAG: PHP domain-containing protein [Opitutaceae bacterium]
MKTYQEVTRLADNGAQFFNADLHVHSFGGSHDVKDSSMTVQAIIDEAVRQNIRILAITDHNSDANTKLAIDYSQKYRDQLLVLAGVEISTAHGHLLVYAAPDKAAKIGQLLARINLVGNQGDQDAHTAMSMADVIKEAAHLGCCSVAAHIDRPKSGFEMFAPGYQNWKRDILTSPGLYGLECDDAAHLNWYSDTDDATDEGINRKRLAAVRISDPATMGRPVLAHLQGSDAHSLNTFVAGKPGKQLTRFKLNDLTFESFRTALVDPEARVRPMATIPRSIPRVLAMQVSGGFLDGEIYHFSSNLNCFIGGRGTGKSTALKVLAYGLGIDAELEDYNNCPQEVSIHCKDADDTPYLYSRVHGGNPIVKAREEGEIVEVSPSAFRVEYYRQGELAKVAENPLKNPQLLQGFLDRHLLLSDLLAKESQLVSALKQNSAQLVPLVINSSGLKKKNELLKDVNAKLKLAEDGKLKEIVAEQTQLASEQTLLASFGDLRDAYKNGLSLDVLRRNFDEIIDLAKPLTNAPECTAALDKVRQTIERANALLANKGKEVNAELEREALAIAAALAELKAAQAKLESKLKDKIVELQKKGLAGNIAEINALIRQKSSLTTEITKINSESAQLKRLNKDRENYLKELAEVRGQITERRKAQLISINENLRKTIQDYNIFVHYDPAGMLEEFKTFILDAMQGSHFREATASIVCAKLFPADLAKLVWNGDIAGIALNGSVDPEWAKELHQKLAFYDKLHALEVMWKAPCPVITVKTKAAVPKAIPVNQLSDGQKHTIMLTIAMLAESNIPLVIDQPEDDLDNAFIYSAVVKVLRTIKERRQVILVTHNANIVVLGDAELLLPMQRKDDGGEAYERGSIDRTETKAAVIKILEGGDIAFRKRQAIYGY